MNDERRGERVPGDRPGDPSGRAGAMPRVADRRPGPPPPVRGPDGRPYPGPPPGGAPRPPGPNGPPGPRPGPGGPGGPGRGPGGPGPAPYGAPTHDQRPPEPPRSPAPEATTRSVAHAPTRAATAVAPAVALRDRAEGTGRGAGSGPPRGPRGPRDDDAGARPPGKRRWRRVRRLIYLAVALLVLGPVLAFVIGWIFFRVPTADEATNNQVATIAYADGSRMAGLAQEQGNRIKVPITQVPVHVQQAVLAAEDRSFYSNYGFDPVGIARAAWNQARGGSGGGSTITQQYVKNVLVGDEYSLWRKYREVVIAAKISQEQSKEEILGNYLNSIYFGRGAYGIQAASQSYFGRDVATLSPSEGAMLAGLIQSPSKWDPAVDKGGSIQRWNFVLDGMVAQKWLAPNARAGAVFPTTVPPSSRSTGVPTNDRGHIVTAVREELAQYGITEQQVNQEGLQITTTIDPRLQQEAVDAAAKALKGQPQNLRTALVSTDPKTGAIRAYYGGTDGSGFDYAQTQRQPGSSFKPFVLLAGLQRDPPIGLGTRFDGSTPQTIAGKVVTNSEGESCPNCDLKAAMTQSINTVFYQLGVQVGPQSVADAAHQAGVTAPLPNPSGGISLGDKEVRPGDMSSAYATFAAEGVYHRPHMVSRVTAADGRVLYDSGAPEGEQRMSAQLARNVVESMTDVASHSKIALSGGRPVASKTGTVQSSTEGQNNDAWMVGFTPSVSTAVWVGTDDNTPIKTSAGRPIYGRGVPGQIWQSFMNDALRGTPTEKFGDYEPIGSAPAPASDSASPSTSPSGQPGGPQYCVDGTCVPLGTDGFPFGNGSGDSGSSGSGQNGSGENGSGNGSSGDGSSGNGSNGNGSNGNGSGGNGSGGSGSGSGSSSDSGGDGDRDLGGLFARRPG